MENEHTAAQHGSELPGYEWDSCEKMAEYFGVFVAESAMWFWDKDRPRFYRYGEVAKHWVRQAARRAMIPSDSFEPDDAVVVAFTANWLFPLDLTEMTPTSLRTFWVIRAQYAVKDLRSAQHKTEALTVVGLPPEDARQSESLPQSGAEASQTWEVVRNVRDPNGPTFRLTTMLRKRDIADNLTQAFIVNAERKCTAQTQPGARAHFYRAAKQLSKEPNIGDLISAVRYVPTGEVPRDAIELARFVGCFPELMVSP